MFTYNTGQKRRIFQHKFEGVTVQNRPKNLKIVNEFRQKGPLFDKKESNQKIQCSVRINLQNQLTD